MEAWAFRSRGDFPAYLEQPAFHGFLHKPSLHRARILFGPSIRRARGGLNENALHEYAHFLQRTNTSSPLPSWFEEGIASLLGHAELRGDRAIVGRSPPPFADQIDTQAIERYLTATHINDWSASELRRFYPFAHLLTHYLAYGHGKDVPNHEAVLDMTPRSIRAALKAHSKRKFKKGTAYSAPLPEVSQADYTCLTPAQLRQKTDGCHRQLESATRTSLFTSGPGKPAPTSAS